MFLLFTNSNGRHVVYNKNKKSMNINSSQNEKTIGPLVASVRNNLFRKHPSITVNAPPKFNALLKNLGAQKSGTTSFLFIPELSKKLPRVPFTKRAMVNGFQKSHGAWELVNNTLAAENLMNSIDTLRKMPAKKKHSVLKALHAREVIGKPRKIKVPTGSVSIKKSSHPGLQNLMRSTRARDRGNTWNLATTSR